MSAVFEGTDVMIGSYLSALGAFQYCSTLLAAVGFPLACSTWAVLDGRDVRGDCAGLSYLS